MSSTDTVTEPWSAKELSPAQRESRHNADLIPFGDHGVSPQTMAQVVEWAKFMAAAKGVVPANLQGNVGGCLAVIELAQKFQMSAYMLARGCFFVSGVLALDGQTTMAIMNKHMPLAKGPNGERARLKYTFTGDKAEWKMEEVPVLNQQDQPTGKKVWRARLITPSTRVITVTGRMENELDDLVYESPQVQYIQNKNSPLWVEDEDQQLIYWASRRWQRRHWPEGLLNIYDKDELPDRMLRDVTPAPAVTGGSLAARIAAAQGDQNLQGFNEAQVTEAVTDMRKGSEEGRANLAEAAHPEVTTTIDGETGEVIEPKKTRRKKADADKLPTNPEEWTAYCLAWIAESDNAQHLNDRWQSELKLRNDCGVTTEQRDPVYEKWSAKMEELGGYKR